MLVIEAIEVIYTWFITFKDVNILDRNVSILQQRTVQENLDCFVKLGIGKKNMNKNFLQLS